jgi:hypothetical protein
MRVVQADPGGATFPSNVSDTEASTTGTGRATDSLPRGFTLNYAAAAAAAGPEPAHVPKTWIAPRK